MKEKVGIIIIASALLLLSSCKSTDGFSSDQIITSKRHYADFCQKADSYLNEVDFSGAVLVAKGDTIIFAKGYGVSDPKVPESAPNTINTIFEAGSITKQMTAAAILKLEAKHKLELDDKIIDYFPNFQAGNDISIRMLLNMRSGLTDHINSAAEFFPLEIYRALEANQKACQPVDKNVVLTYLSNAPMLAKPDSTYFYCNTNYYLLANIIEAKTGISYYDYMKKNILKKCRMKNSNFDFQHTDAKGYTAGRYYSIPAGLSFGCGDLNSSVVDLFKWNRCLVKGKIISKKYIRALKKAKGYNYGFNCGNKMIFHAGNTNVFNSYNSYSFKNGISIIVLANRPMSQTNTTVIAGKLRKIENW